MLLSESHDIKVERFQKSMNPHFEYYGGWAIDSLKYRFFFFWYVAQFKRKFATLVKYNLLITCNGLIGKVLANLMVKIANSYLALLPCSKLSNSSTYLAVH